MFGTDSKVNGEGISRFQQSWRSVDVKLQLSEWVVVAVALDIRIVVALTLCGSDKSKGKPFWNVPGDDLEAFEFSVDQ